MINNLYKKNLFALLIVAMLLVNIQIAIPAGSPVLKMTLLRYDPTPAKPGDYITAYVQVENIGDAQAKNAKLTFTPNYPFSIDQASDGEKFLGKIEVGQLYIAEVKIRVDINAVYGQNDLKFTVTDDYTTPSSSKIDKVFSISIDSRDQSFDLESVSVTPTELTPGDSGKIALSIKNNADSTFSDVKSTLLLFVQSGTTTIDLPFAVKDSVVEKNLGVISSGEKKEVIYEIITYPTITPGIYKLPIQFTYYDNSGKNFTKIKYITLMINPKVDVYLTIDSTKISKEMKTGVLSIKLVNKGIGGIKFTNMKLGNSDSFDLLSTSQENYMGNIDSDDYKTADYELLAKKDKLTIPVTVTFKDSLNQEHTISSNLELNILSKNALTPKKTNYTGLIILLVIIVGGIIYFVRRKKRK